MSEWLAVLAGPTAVGKTHFAALLAERHGLEIISADSRQIYRGLDIGTAKPTAAERARARHHVIDVCDPRETYDLSRFIADAEAALADIVRRGKRPLVVGGTGLYIRGLTEGIFEDVSRDPAVRTRLEARAESEGAPALHAELAREDPAAAARIHANDALRIIRALEVLEVTGRPISDHQRLSRQSGPRHPRRLAVLDLPRETLNARIDQRTRAMFETGLLEETAGLVGAGMPIDAPGLRAIGYPQAIGVLRQRLTREEAVAQTALATRRYAKRQVTWFRSEAGAVWIDGANQSEDEIVSRLEKTLAIARG